MAEQRPNVVVIICDDLCYGDLSCHGNPQARTPHLDQLYAEGTRCARWCSGPLCSPARASLMTGHWHLRTRVIDTYCGRSMLDTGELTLGDVLGAAGYATGCFGKWHLGDCHPMRPEDHGFSETLWHRSGGIGQPGDFPENHRRRFGKSYFDPLLVRNGATVTSQGYCTDIFTDAAIAFIEQHTAAPFFCYLAFNAPHTPLQVPDSWADPYRAQGLDDELARLYGMNACIDANVGRLLAALDRLQLAQDTIVLFTSDHGPCGSAPRRWNAGLRGLKGSVYDGGIRVPALWRWPGRIPTARDIAEPTHPVDLLPTLAAFCGAAPDPGRPPDGRDLSQRLLGAEAGAERQLFMQWHRGDVPLPGLNAAVIEPRLKWIRPDPAQPAELYDLLADPSEQHDLAPTLPTEERRLAAAYDDWFARMGCSLGADTYDPPDISIGHPAEPVTLLTTNDWRILGPEGWKRDDLRGEWRLAAARGGTYRIRLQFRDGAPSGLVRLRLGGTTTSVDTQDADGWWSTTATLPAGQVRLEAWLETPAQQPGLRAGRYLAALYAEVRVEAA